MKSTISFLILWLVLLHTCIAQTAPVREDVIIDTVTRYNASEHKEVSLDLQVNENDLFKKLIIGYLETPVTVIESRENTKGNRSVRAYVNNNYVSIACHGINAGNFKEYRAYKQYLPAIEGIEIDSFVYPIEFQISKVDQKATLLEGQINEEKSLYYQNKFWYCIKDKGGRVVSSLTVEFVFPKPQIYKLYINSDLVKLIKDRPVESPVYVKEGLNERNNMDLARENKAKINPNDTTDVPSELVLRAGNKDVLFVFKALNFQEANYLEYRLNDDGWKTSAQKEYPHILLENLKPGKHTLQVRYPLQPAVFEYDFEIEPAFTETTAFKVIAGILLTVILGAFLFLIYSSRQKRKLKNEVNKRTQLQHQITYLQSQLQPHFIFNALNSIQGLINKRNIEDANIYISKFGALLHEVIGKSDKTMQPLATEIKQVEYYLQLEQLRFKFQYAIAVAGNVNTTEISIPTMLLQPFVENAIKHGIVEKKEAGIIEVVISRSNNDLHIEIKDNGKGYDINTTKAGRGNAMVEERIQALNSLLKDQTIQLTTRTVIQEGTSVSINFINWL